MKIPLKDLSSILGAKPSIYIGSFSFDSRFDCVAKSLDSKYIKKAIIFSCPGLSASLEEQREPFVSLFTCPIYATELHNNQSISNVKAIERVLLERIFPEDNIIIDITTFSHETLLQLVRVLNNLGLISKCIFLYAGAEKYGTSTHDSIEKSPWLSRGVQDVRAVLGYPGLSLPSRRLHLMLMVGFESERAEVVIEHYEPAALSMGLGDRLTSFSEEHHKTNHHFFQRVSAFSGSILGRTAVSVNEFQFSCNDPLETKRAILQQVIRYIDYNTVVCPLNTKISTLGAAFAALENESIQLCYPKPIEYNVKNYASPGDHCTIFRGSDL